MAAMDADRVKAFIKLRRFMVWSPELNIFRGQVGR
jgi:hypothetical protein